MNKKQIKEELHRSACDDNDPWRGCEFDAWCFATFMIEGSGTVSDLKIDDQRTFYLLVAEAM